MSVAASLARVRGEILRVCAQAGRDPGSVRLLPVSKGRSLELVREALDCGVLELGENRVQELAEKAEELAAQPVRWHLIGSLQTNKVKQLLRVPSLAFVHSLDRIKLADALQAELAAQSRVLDVLVQVHATGEATKHGIVPEAAAGLVAHVTGSCPNLALRGLMAMGPLEGDPLPVFGRVARLCEEMRQRHGLPLPVLSMGMSGDLAAAIECGATLVRVGRAVFE
jgi:pyridoxal phosphate enzyme (YggS family)